MRRLLIAAAVLALPVGLALSNAVEVQAAAPCILGQLCQPGTAPSAAPTARPSSTPAPTPAPSSQPSPAPTPQPSSSPAPAPSASPPAPQPDAGAGANIPTDVGVHAVEQAIFGGASWALQVVQKSMGVGTPPVDWFAPLYSRMVSLAVALYMGFAILGLIQGAVRRDAWLMWRIPLIYTPMAIFIAAMSIAFTQILLQVTDIAANWEIASSQPSVDGLIGHSSVLVGALAVGVGASIWAGVGAIVGAAIAAFIIVACVTIAMEFLLREALIYIALFFMPIAGAAMIWPWLQTWLVRLIELLVGVILLKPVIFGIIAVGATMFGASPNSFSAFGDSGLTAIFMGFAVLFLAMVSPWGMSKIIPFANAIGNEFHQPLRSSLQAPAQITRGQMQQAVMQKAMRGKAIGGGAGVGAGTAAAMYLTDSQNRTIGRLQSEPSAEWAPTNGQHRQGQVEEPPPHTDEDHPQYPGTPVAHGTPTRPPMETPRDEEPPEEPPPSNTGGGDE